MTYTELPEEAFRIRPWPESDLWALVHVAPDLHVMRTELQRFAGECHPEQLAACMSVEPDGGNREGLVVVLFFARDWLGAGYVTHELAHAAFRFCEHVGLQVRHWEQTGYTFATQPATEHASPEEQYCHFLEHLTKNFWREASVRGYCS